MDVEPFPQPLPEDEEVVRSWGDPEPWQVELSPEDARHVSLLQRCGMEDAEAEAGELRVGQLVQVVRGKRVGLVGRVCRLEYSSERLLAVIDLDDGQSVRVVASNLKSTDRLAR